MKYISGEFSLYWLAGALGLFVLFGLLKMQVAISKMMRDDDGKFEVVSFSTNEKITKHLYDQKSYAAYTNRLAAIVGAFSLLCSVIFLATLFF